MKEQEIYEQFKANIVETTMTAHICYNADHTITLGAVTTNPNGTIHYSTVDDKVATEVSTLDEAFEHIYNQVGFSAYKPEE